MFTINFFIFIGFIVEFSNSVKLNTIPLVSQDNKITTSIQNDGKAFSSSTQLLNDSIINIGIESTTTPSKHSKNDGAFTNSLDNMGDNPVKLTTKLINQQMLTQKKPSTTSEHKSVVENPHELSVANVEKFVNNYFARNSRNSKLLLEKSTEAPSVKHILQVISLTTNHSTSVLEHTSKKPKNDLIANIRPPLEASALSAERRRTVSQIVLNAGNIIGIVFGVLVLMLGFIYVGMSYFRKARRRSSYTDMFIQDTDNEEEIALADYTEARTEHLVQLK